MRLEGGGTVGAELLAALLLLSALVGGGGPGLPVVAIHGLGGAALAWGLWRRRATPASASMRTLDRLLMASGVLVFSYLIPIPVAVWASLPERAPLLADLRTAGIVADALPVSLDTSGTVRALLSLQSFAGMWVLATTLDAPGRQRLLALAVATGTALAVVGFVQVSAKADTTGATAIFDNRNHFASLLAMLLPLALAFAFTAPPGAHARRWVCLGVAGVLLLAAGLTFSRTGSVLAAAAAVTALLLVRGQPWRGRSLPRSLPAALGLAALVVAALGWLVWPRLGARFEAGLVGDLRWTHVEHGLDALRAYLPWGGGPGSFRWVYQEFEPATGLGFYLFAQHAHNELVEIGIEAGVAGLAIASAFAAWVSARAIGTLHAPSGAWRRASAVACLVPLLHSLVDFPLRTEACSLLLAACLATMCAGDEAPARSRVRAAFT